MILDFEPTERQRVGPAWESHEKEQNWIWVVAGDLDGFDGAAIRDLGHLRWKIENNAFGELTQHWHLTHCSHHHPVAVVALLWIKIIAFTLFHAFALLPFCPARQTLDRTVLLTAGIGGSHKAHAE